jgi:hypothetical protein
MPEKTKNNWNIEPSMLIITSNWGPTPSFKLMPITENSPFIEIIYNPMGKALAVIGTKKKDVFHMVERLDENGDPRVRKGKVMKEEPFQKQRVTVESYSEYYISERNEIENFLKNVAINHDTFNYKQYLDMKTMDTPNILGNTVSEPVELINVK